MEQHININTENLYLNETLHIQQLSNGDLLISKIAKPAPVQATPPKESKNVFGAVLAAILILLFLLAASQQDEANLTSATAQQEGGQSQ